MHRFTHNQHVQTLWNAKKGTWIKRLWTLWLVTSFIVWLVERTDQHADNTTRIMGISAIIALIAFLFTAVKDIWQYADNEKLNQFVRVAVVKKMEHAITEQDVHIVNIQKGVVTVRVHDTVYFIYQGKQFYSIYLVEVGKVVEPNDTIRIETPSGVTGGYDTEEDEIEGVRTIQDDVTKIIADSLQTNPKIIALKQGVQTWKQQKNHETCHHETAQKQTVTLSCGLRITCKQQTIRFEVKQKTNKTAHRFDLTHNDMTLLYNTLQHFGRASYKRFDDYTLQDKNAYANYRKNDTNETIYLEQNGQTLLINTPILQDDILYQFNRERLVSYLLDVKEVCEKAHIPTENKQETAVTGDVTCAILEEAKTDPCLNENGEHELKKPIS